MDNNGLFLFGLVLSDLMFGVGFVTEVVEVVVVAECRKFLWLLAKKLVIGIDAFILFASLMSSTYGPDCSVLQVSIKAFWH